MKACTVKERSAWGTMWNFRVHPRLEAFSSSSLVGWMATVLGSGRGAIILCITCKAWLRCRGRSRGGGGVSEKEAGVDKRHGRSLLRH